MSTVFPLRLDNPLVMSGWGLGVHRPYDEAQRVFVILLLSDKEGNTGAVSILSPDQARDMAVNLLHLANEAESESLQRSQVAAL